MTFEEAREMYLIEHPPPGAPEAEFLNPEEAAERIAELGRRAADRKNRGEPRIWRWEDYPGDEGPAIFEEP